MGRNIERIGLETSYPIKAKIFDRFTDFFLHILDRDPKKFEVYLEKIEETFFSLLTEGKIEDAEKMIWMLGLLNNMRINKLKEQSP